MTRVKICGLRRREDVERAVELGADALGFVFWPASPRFIAPDEARALVRGVPPLVATVGVFVDQPPDHVAEVARELRLSAVQLHGSEDLSAYAGLPCRLIKAIAVSDDAADAEQLLSRLPDEAMPLLDAHDPIRRGGTGRTIDWASAAPLARRRPLILSGGLRADNVQRAVTIVRPHAVDVSSGVESAPGSKSMEKLQAFFAAMDAVNRASATRAS